MAASIQKGMEGLELKTFKPTEEIKDLELMKIYKHAVGKIITKSEGDFNQIGTGYIAKKGMNFLLKRAFILVVSAAHLDFGAALPKAYFTLDPSGEE